MTEVKIEPTSTKIRSGADLFSSACRSRKIATIKAPPVIKKVKKEQQPKVMNTSDHFNPFNSDTDNDSKRPATNVKDNRAQRLKMVLMSGCGRSQPVAIATEDAIRLIMMATESDNTIFA